MHIVKKNYVHNPSKTSLSPCQRELKNPYLCTTVKEKKKSRQVDVFMIRAERHIWGAYIPITKFLSKRDCESSLRRNKWINKKKTWWIIMFWSVDKLLFAALWSFPSNIKRILYLPPSLPFIRFRLNFVPRLNKPLLFCLELIFLTGGRRGVATMLYVDIVVAWAPNFD